MISFKKKLGCAIFMVFLMGGSASVRICCSSPPLPGNWPGRDCSGGVLAEYAEYRWGEMGKILGKVIESLFVGGPWIMH